MSKYILIITGEGPCPDNVSALLPWAKKSVKVELPGHCLNEKGLTHVVSTCVSALVNHMGWEING